MIEVTSSQCICCAAAGTLLTTPILGAMLGDAPVRMVSCGQEFTVDMDEKTLAEVQLKDSQVGMATHSNGVVST